MKNDLIAKAKALLEGKQLNEKITATKFNHPDITTNMLDAIGELDGDDVESLLQHMIDVFTYDDDDNSDVNLLVKNLKTTLRDWKGRHSN